MQPQDPPQDRHYGWVLVAFTALAFGAVSGAVNSIGVFLIPLSEAFGWPRGATAFAHLVGNLSMGLLGIPLGWLAGRRSVRPIAMLGVTSCGVALLLLSSQTTLWQFYLYYGVLGGLGFGALWSPLLANLGGWFTQRRGLAMGIATAGTMLGSSVLPWLARRMISTIGWSGAYRTLGLGVLIVLLPASLLVRDPPRREPPRQEPQPSSTGSPVQGGGRPARTLGVAGLMTWICGAMVLDRIAMGTAMVNMVALAQDHGMAPQRAAGVLAVFFGASVLGRILFGRLADALGGLRAWIVVAGGIALAAVWLPLALWEPFYFALAFLLGLINVSPTLALLTVTEHVPPAARGSSIAIASLFGFGSGGVGGWMGGALFDLTGSYRLAFANASVLALLAVAVLWGLHRRLRRHRRGVAPVPG